MSAGRKRLLDEAVCRLSQNLGRVPAKQDEDTTKTVLTLLTGPAFFIPLGSSTKCSSFSLFEVQEIHVLFVKFIDFYTFLSVSE
jgi:hypothetical protein